MTTTLVPVLATAVRKARFESTCGLCGGCVHIGQYIGRCSGGLWFHASCWVERGHRHHADMPDQCASKETPA